MIPLVSIATNTGAATAAANAVESRYCPAGESVYQFAVPFSQTFKQCRDARRRGTTAVTTELLERAAA